MTYLYHGYMLFTHLFPILLSRADKKCAVQKCLARTNRTTGLFQKKKKILIDISVKLTSSFSFFYKLEVRLKYLSCII